MPPTPVPPPDPAAAPASPGADDDAHLRSGDAGAVAVTGGTLRLQTRILSLGFSLVASIVLVRALSEGQFGDLSLIVAMVTIVSGVSDLGLSGVGIREWIRRGRAERRALLADLLGLRIVAIAIGSVAALAFALVAGYDSDVVSGMAAALVGTAFNAIGAALTIPLIARLRQALVGVLELLFIAVQSLLQILLALVGAGVVPIAAALIPAGLAGLVAVISVSEERPPLPRFELAPLKRLLRESAAFAAAGAVSVVYLRAAVLLGPAFLTADEFGAFSVAFRAVESLTMLPSMLTMALFPVLAHAALHDRERLSRGYDVLWRSTTALGAITAAGVIGVAPLITLVFTGGRDPITVDAFVILGAALGALFVGAAGMWMLLAERHYRAVLAINVVALSTNVAVTCAVGAWLSPRWFALGILVSEIGIAVAADAVCRRGLARSGHPVPGGPARHLAKVVLAVAAALAAFVVTRDMFPLIPLAAALAAGGAVLLGLRGVPPELVGMGREVALRLTRRRAASV